jgi:hypothetical protein
MATTKSILRDFLVYFLTQETRQKQKKPWNDIKIGIFFHVQVNDALASNFLNTPFSFGHEKISFEYVMDFEKN